MLDPGNWMTKGAQIVASKISSIQKPESAGLSNGFPGNHLVGKYKIYATKGLILANLNGFGDLASTTNECSNSNPYLFVFRLNPA